MKSFNVIWQDFNARKFEPYDVMPYLIKEYNKTEDKPKTYLEFYEFIKQKSLYQYWARCEYEILICGWPNTKTRAKWDIHQQIMMNIDIITELLMENVNGNSEETIS